MEIGTTVALKKNINHKCPAGREDNTVATIVSIFDDGNGVKVQPELHGCKYWSVDDIYPVDLTPVQTDTISYTPTNGCALRVGSWENDGDNPQTKWRYGIDIRLVPLFEYALKQMRSVNGRGDRRGCYGNERDMREDDLINCLIDDLKTQFEGQQFINHSVYETVAKHTVKLVGFWGDDYDRVRVFAGLTVFEFGSVSLLHKM